jgi:membrane protease YdiL (CAAX protease family)
MDGETAAKHVLLDFELVTLVALGTGVLLYGVSRGLARRRRGGVGDAGGPYDGFDLVLMLFPAALFLLGPIAEVLAPERGESAGEASQRPPGVLGLAMNIGYFTFVGVMTYGLNEWVRNRRVAELFGLRRLRLANIVVISILGGVLSLLLCGWLVGDFSSRYLESLFGELDAQEPVKMIQETNSTLHFALSVALACVAAPVVEEMLFRGYMYGTLRQLTHPIFAAAVVGALFAVVHGNLPALLPLWVFSILLTTAYELTRCLWVPVGMHAFFNAANIVMMTRAGSAD